VGVPMRRVLHIVQEQRDARYNLLRGYFHGADDDGGTEDFEQERLATVTLPSESEALGCALSQLPLGDQGVRVVSLRRSNGRVVDPASDPPLKDGDTLVLSGRPDTLAVAEELLLRG
jgi:CPA2 family monovalent cation:H+ antiporter-2